MARYILLILFLAGSWFYFADRAACAEEDGASVSIPGTAAAELSTNEEMATNEAVGAVPSQATAANKSTCNCQACQAKKADQPDRVTCCHGCEINWSKLPGSIRAIPRPGNFAIPYGGPGYYSWLDHWCGNCQEKPPQSGYPAFALMPPSFFDADFRYVDKLDPCQMTLVERLKRIQLNDCLLFSTGGNAWARFMNEHNSRLTEADNSYLLARTRAYGDLAVGDLARVFGEYIWADSFSEELAPQIIDVNRGDILNLFLDLNVLEYGGQPTFMRVGRQELLLGSQRLVSALDWANTRRTFDGLRLFRQGEKWDMDLFYTQFVPPDANDFDRPDEDQDFAGAWLTYRPQKGDFVDFYYLFLNNSNTVVQQGIERAPFDLHTLGTRWTGAKNEFLWDYELMLQLGEQEAADIVAGAATAGVGRHFKSARFSPTAWIYYDYASGDSRVNAERYTTFNQLFPFGHYYLGWIDLVGRQNIHDLNGHVIMQPVPWLTLVAQYHHFWLASDTDALYNAGGAAIRRDPTGQAGSNVGDELDLYANLHVCRYSDILVGYSKLFGGSFLERTAGGGLAEDSELFHLMYQTKW